MPTESVASVPRCGMDVIDRYIYYVSSMELDKITLPGCVLVQYLLIAAICHLQLNDLVEAEWRDVVAFDFLG